MDFDRNSAEHGECSYIPRFIHPTLVVVLVFAHDAALPLQILVFLENVSNLLIVEGFCTQDHQEAVPQDVQKHTEVGQSDLRLLLLPEPAHKLGSVWCSTPIVPPISFPLLLLKQQYKEELGWGWRRRRRWREQQ